MDKVRGDEFRKEGGQNIGEEDESFRDRGTDKVNSRREDDNIADIVDNACRS